MSLEQEIKDFMNSVGVDVVGVAGPGRFDGPPSLDPNYILKGAKSIIAYAVPLDAQAIYDFLGKKSAIPHNLDQTRVHQRAIHAGLKLSKFLESKGYKACTDSPNIKWRKTLNPVGSVPRFSVRYGAYVSGIAAPGLSGNAVTKEYGASAIFSCVFTDAELNSDPIMDPREIFDNVCQKCMACAASCPTKMFENHEEEYALLNGHLYPRGKKRDINLCNIGCAGFHAASPNLKYSNWGLGYRKDWLGKIPDPKKQNLLWELMKETFLAPDFGMRMHVGDPYVKPFEEGLFEAPNFPDYEDLPGETEGQKIKAYAKKMEEIVKYPVDYPFPMTCGSCMAVCGSGIDHKENIKRWKILNSNGFVVMGENKEPIITYDAKEALAIREAHPYAYKKEIRRTHLKGLMYLFSTKFGFDLHGTLRKGKYYRRLEAAIAEKGRQDAHVDLKARERVMEEIGANDGLKEASEKTNAKPKSSSAAAF